MGLVTFLLYLQIEFYYSLCYSNVIFLNKLLRITKSVTPQNYLSAPGSNSVYFAIILLAIFFSKAGGLLFSSLLIFSVLYLMNVNKVLEKITKTSSKNNAIYLVLPTFAIFFYFLYFVKSLLTLFFFIEVYSVLYYFCFLTSYTFTNQTILKYKNGLLFLLWNNFLTTFFLGLGCFCALRASGTTDFAELSIIYTSLPSLYFFLVGLFWKLGLPLFHFFKLEVYKYLLRENVFLFSVITTLINTVILFVCLSQPILYNTIYLYNFLILTILFSVILAIINLNLTNILHFFALSGVFTMSTVLTVFLI